MSVHVKICGIRDAGSATTAVQAGADALGFVFHSGSPRLVTPEHAASIAVDLPAHVEKIAVFLRPEPTDIESVLEIFAADRVQADHETIGHLSESMRLPVYRQGEAIDLVARPTRFLYEGRRSGVGERVDWELAASMAGRGHMTLAGGLHPGNVGSAIDAISPFGVDVSSGVESAPGIKDKALIEGFLAAVRERETEKVNP
jgi:phosphoribosylanthranilate isomerase